jgi:3-oxoacyl-[acyl-carrier protein] reductase
MPTPAVKGPFDDMSASAFHAVLVTGGSGGIGRAICRAFGEAGWRVGVHYRRRIEDAEQTVNAVQAGGGDGIPLQADIGDPEEVGTMFEQFLSQYGRLDALICSAGETVDGLVLRLDPAKWQTVIDTNLTGTFHCLRAAGPIMQQQLDGGSIVIVGSYAGQQGRSGQAAYAASKAGLLGLMRSAAREWGPVNVRVNLVFPGWHRTRVSHGAFPDPSDFDDHLLGRPPDVSEVARTIVRLTGLQDLSGQVWNLDSRIF